MGRTVAATAAALFFCAAAAPAALAACTTSHIAGPWRLFASGPFQDLAGDPITDHVEYDCRLVFNREGELLRGRCTSPLSFIPPGDDTLRLSYARLGGSCWVQIHIGDRLTGVNLRGQMTPDRQLVVGQGKTYDDPAYVMFQMVRIR